MTMVMAAAWVAWAITSQAKIFDFCLGEGFDRSARSLAKNVVFAA